MKMQVVAGGRRWEGNGGTGRRKERRRRKRGGQDPGRTTLNSQALNSRRLLGEGNTKKITRGKEEKHLTKVLNIKTIQKVQKKTTVHTEGNLIRVVK